MQTHFKLTTLLTSNYCIALEGADVTLSYKPEEKEDAAHIEKYITEKTNGKSKVAHAPFDLRTEEECQKMLDTHLKAHNGRLDTLYASTQLSY